MPKELERKLKAQVEKKHPGWSKAKKDAYVEKPLAMDMAAIICNELCCTVTVTTGIHFEGFSKKEMDGAIEAAGTLMDLFLKEARKHPPIL